VSTSRSYILIFLAGALSQAMPAHAAPKTDILVMDNGDRLTGEIKELSRGKLRLNTDSLDTIYVQWNKVVGLQSRQRLEVELAESVRYFGSAEPGAEPGHLLIKDTSESTPIDVKLIDVVAIYPIDQGRRLAMFDGYITAGYSYAKANDLQEFAFTGGISTTQEKRMWSLDASTAVTTQTGANDTQRFDVTARHRRFLQRKLFWQGTLEFESNDELALDLRTTLGGAFGKYLVQSNRQDWAVYAGLNVTSENEVATENQKNLEALFGTSYAFFRYDSPERSVNAEANVLPSLTESGRVRLGAKLRMRIELVKDFFFELSMYGIHDNRPGEHATSKSDYGTQTSLGYSF
jgi:hypothetical protein